MKPLSTAQTRIFSKLREYKQRTGDTPDLSAFARDLGMHYVSLKQHIEALDKKGYLTFESRGRGRSPLLELPPEATGIPVLGNIPAGPLSEAVQEAESYLPLTGIDTHFALRVSGDSMADLVQDGDIVLFKQQPKPLRSGEMCAVRVDGSEVTLKYLDFLDQDSYALRPHNPLYPTIRVEARDLTVAGVYQGLLRGEVLGSLLQDTTVS